MSHSRELIQSILEKVQRDYPVGQFIYTTEKAIPGTRMHPDIFVCDLNGKPQCAVEIGYTRPEKLTAYRGKLKIPDVRWYDKAGNLHADVEERVVRVSIETKPLGLFVAYCIDDLVLCYSDDCAEEAKSVEATDAMDRFDEITEYLATDTLLLIITDYTRVWFWFTCDKCGEFTQVSEEYSVDVWAVAEDLRTLNGREFANNWGNRTWRGNWDGAVEYAKHCLNAELNYDDGNFLSEEARRDFNRAVTAIRRDSRVSAGAA